MATENKNLSTYDKASIPNAKDFRFGIVVSEWNENITQGLKNGAVEALLDNEVSEENIVIWDAPGTFELPYACKHMGCLLQGNGMPFLCMQHCCFCFIKR